MSTITAYGSKGLTLQIAIATVDTAVGQLASFTPPSGKVQTERADPLETKHDIPVATGNVNCETSQFQIYFDPMNDSHEYLVNVTNDKTNTDLGTLHTFTATWTQISGIDPMIFTGIPEECALSNEVGSLLKADVTVQVSEITQLPLPTGP